MRTQNSINNIVVSIIGQVVLVLLGFFSRSVFINSLGVEYLGINGLLMSVLSMLSLAELGIGTSIVYSLYKPLAEKDIPQIIALVQLYKKAYRYIALIVFVLGLLFYPVLMNSAKSSFSFLYVSIVYFIFLGQSIISYLYAYKFSLINADQKGYITSSVNIVFRIISEITKVFILLTTQDYILFLMIGLVFLIMQNGLNARIVDKKYPYIITSQVYKVDGAVKKTIIENVKASFLHNVGAYVVFGTDNLLISILINVTTVGIYSNYSMLLGQTKDFLTPIFIGITASMGHLIATESTEKKYSIFKILMLANFWTYAVAGIFLFNLLNPFITWWIGAEMLVDNLTLYILIVNFYVIGMRSSVNLSKSAAGIFKQDQYVPLLESGINLACAIILCQYYGLAGIFMGTLVSTLCTVFWNAPRLVYKYIFQKSVGDYFAKYFIYTGVMLVVGAIATYACQILVSEISFAALLVRGFICITIPNVIFFLIFRKTSEFKYIWQVLTNMVFKRKYGNAVQNIQ